MPWVCNLDGPEAEDGLMSHEAMLVKGSGNQIDANMAMPDSVGTCIRFVLPGNYFGGDQYAAATPYFGTAGQADWGGNVAC